METIEFKKTYRAYYTPKPAQPEIITLPAMKFLMVDGQGDPNTSQQFQDAIGAIYPVVFGIKFAHKKAGVGPDYTLGPLEALWWTKAGQTFASSSKQDWLWTVMMWVPDFITSKEVKQFTALAKQKKPNPALDKLRLEVFDEGTVVQLMHIGPYGDEQPNIERMHAFAEQAGYKLRGKHHEIYLGDPRRAAPEKLRTILRQPITR